MASLLEWQRGLQILASSAHCRLGPIASSAGTCKAWGCSTPLWQTPLSPAHEDSSDGGMPAGACLNRMQRYLWATPHTHVIYRGHASLQGPLWLWRNPATQSTYSSLAWRQPHACATAGDSVVPGGKTSCRVSLCVHFGPNAFQNLGSAGRTQWGRLWPLGPLQSH